MQAAEIDPEKVAKVFGALLKERRSARRVSQEKLAELGDLDRSYISLLERGLRQPSLAVLLKLSIALDLDLGSLLGDLLSRASGQEIKDGG